MHRIFLLSPAHCGGERARIVTRPEASFALARQLRAPEGAPLGEVFQFMSGLYFRGKLAYARAFARPPDGVPGVLVITPNRGLVEPDTHVTLDAIRAFARTDVHESVASYRRPLEKDARKLAATAGSSCELVLLGSIATGKYVAVLQAAFNERLCFPADFVGRGDMSRGGLLLRAVRAATELRYVPVAGAIRHGARPAKLAPLPRASRAARGSGADGSVPTDDA